MTPLDVRRRRWSEQAGILVLLDDDELSRLVEGSRTLGWGASSTATLPDGSSVFVKRLPLTELEHERTHSTRNHFRLPAVYQYGVGSAGFGAWRELAVHVTTTGWVIDGSCEGFPMLVHHRVMRRRGGGAGRDTGSWAESPEYVKYWNDSKRIAAFIEARRATPFELWLVLEFVPRRMFDWLREHQSSVGGVVDQLLTTIRFLHDHGVFHFDAHYGNVVTDGSMPLLTDFGLANDRAFHLSPTESAFLDRHRHYDFGETIYSAGNALLGLLAPMSREERKALLRRFRSNGPIDQDRALDLLVSNVETLASENLLGLSPAYADVVARYRPVIQFMNAFFSTMRGNPRKNTFFDDSRLAGLLADAGVDVG
ncbi:MAG TPA: hypothetical protein VM143_07035 [Acidimicrobiales bacterium]|nr:hypothetical protein [Acidimicrobiales bacterium]